MKINPEEIGDGIGYFLAKRDKTGDTIVIGINGQISSGDKWPETIPSGFRSEFSGFSCPLDPLTAIYFRKDILENDSYDSLFNEALGHDFKDVMIEGCDGSWYGMGDIEFIQSNFISW